MPQILIGASISVTSVGGTFVALGLSEGGLLMLMGLLAGVVGVVTQYRIERNDR